MNIHPGYARLILSVTEQHYSDFLQHCVRYILHFLQKGYPASLLLGGLLSVWRNGRHTYTKYEVSPTVWHEDILQRLPQHYLEREKKINPTPDSSNSNSNSIFLRSHSPPNSNPPPLVLGTAVPGFTSGGLTHTSHNTGGFSTITRKRKLTTTELHNARMAKRRRDNAYYNARYNTNTYISHPTWGLRHAYMTQHPMWLRDQLITGNSICW